MAPNGFFRAFFFGRLPAPSTAAVVVKVVTATEALVAATGMADRAALVAALVATAVLQHPRLVRLLGLCDAPPATLGLVYSYAAGLTLKTRLAEARAAPTTEPLGVAARLQVAVDVATALAYLHRRVAVHGGRQCL